MLCNECGIPETELKGGKCCACGHICDIDHLIDRRAYDYADKHGLLDSHARFTPLLVREKLSKSRLYSKAPLYLSAAASEEVLSFKNLNEMPAEQIFRCCKDSKDRTFRVGVLVYRHKTNTFDGIIFPQENGLLPADECNGIFTGASFENPCPMSDYMYRRSTQVDTRTC